MIRYTEPFCLSATGSTRATAYNWGNKSVTVHGRTHVVWLDAVAQVCGRTYDHTSGAWGETFRLFEGCDNHANPSLTADGEGRLRLVYGPHGWYGEWNQGRIKWCRSAKPGSFESWDATADFGYNATAAAIVHTPSGLDVVVSRGGERPPATVFHRQRRAGGWTSAKPLLHQEIEPQYTHHYGHILCDDEGTLYAACHFYNVGGGDNQPVTGEKHRMHSYGMAVLRSTDMGDTWTDLRGVTVGTPALYEERIAIPPIGADMYVHGIALGPDRTLWALVNQPGLRSRELLLHRWDGGAWQTTHLEPVLPPDRVAVDGVLTIDLYGGIHVAVAAVLPERASDAAAWGHASNEIFHLYSSDGARTFACAQVSAADRATPNWLPSLPKHGPFHPVIALPILYTHGLPGEGCAPETRTDVWCVFANRE